MYAVLHVANFSLQALRRTDPTLVTSGPAGAVPRPPLPLSSAAAAPPRASPPQGDPAGAAAALAAASFDLPRGTGSFRGKDPRAPSLPAAARARTGFPAAAAISTTAEKPAPSCPSTVLPQPPEQLGLMGLVAEGEAAEARRQAPKRRPAASAAAAAKHAGPLAASAAARTPGAASAGSPFPPAQADVDSAADSDSASRAGDDAAPALALVSGDTKKALILQVDPRARLAGVEPGMTAPQAQARCPAIVLRTPSPTADVEAQRALLACALNVSPVVEDTAPGVCTIDVRGLAAANRSRVLAQAICQLSELGLTTTGGIGPTPLLALYAARETTSVRTVDKPDAFLHPLPLAVAEPPPALAEVLRSWGIALIGQFTALPQQDVVRRLGSEGHEFWERARGGEPRPLTPYAPPAQFSASLALEYELETTEGVLFILRRFVDRLALELRTAGRVAAELTLSLTLANEAQHERSFRLPEPTAREDVLFRTLDTYLESLRTDSGVVGVALRIEPVRPLVRQPGLFETGLKDPHGFAETLARVSAVVGSGQLGTPELENSHQPDAVKLVTPPQVVPPPEQTPIWPSTGLPLRRYRPALAAHVELAKTGKPAFVTGPQIHSPVLAVRGPFRSSGEWWKNESWSREEWDVELSLGGIYRVARIKEAWYLDGEYE